MSPEASLRMQFPAKPRPLQYSDAASRCTAADHTAGGEVFADTAIVVQHAFATYPTLPAHVFLDIATAVSYIPFTPRIPAIR
jgi:hypothetical protein